MRTPQVYTLPVSRCGSHETFVVIINGLPTSIDSWNFVKDEESGMLTFFCNNNIQLHFHKDQCVSVIRT